MQNKNILFAATLCVLSFCSPRGNCDFQKGPLKSTKVLGFSWENCGSATDPAVMKALFLSPDPIIIPGDLKANATGSTSVAFTSPLSVNVTLEKEVAGIWVKVSCVDELGSCNYSDACQILDILTPPGEDCPEPLRTYVIPCRCPFKAGDYSLPDSDFYLTNVGLPPWLTNGTYKVVGVLGSAGQELGCLKLTFSLRIILGA